VVGFSRAVEMKKLFAATTIACVFGASLVQTAQKNDTKAPEPKRPKLVLRARPAIGIAPLRVVLTVELEGGDNDFEQYYCPTTVWEFADGAISEASPDCPPYEAGKSEIRRRYTVEHTYKRSGYLRVYFSLQHRGKEVAATSVNISVQPGGVENR
jgi:hypothetical protein